MITLEVTGNGAWDLFKNEAGGPQFCRNAAIRLRNLADLFEAMAEGKIDMIVREGSDDFTALQIANAMQYAKERVSPDQIDAAISSEPQPTTEVDCVVLLPITERIKQHFVQGMSYHDLMWKVFPPSQFPRAWNYQSNGGPPGCAMAFGKALNKLGLVRCSDNTIHKTTRCEF